MRTIALMLLSFTAVSGCSVRSQEPAPEAYVVAYDARPASALVFDLPVARHVGPIHLDRAERAAGAFVGYGSGVTTAVHSRTDDSFTGWDSFGGWFSRRTVTDRTGVVQQ